MALVPNNSPQQLPGTDFSTEFTSQKQSTGELCEVLNIALSTNAQDSTGPTVPKPLITLCLQQVSVTLTLYIFALLTALLWGITPIMSKRGIIVGGNSTLNAFSVVFVSTVLFFVLAVLRHGERLFSAVKVEDAAVFVFAGVVGTALGRISLYIGVDRVGASINTAGNNTRPLFATFFALVLLEESLELIQLAGIVILVVGLVIVSISGGGNIGDWSYVNLVFPVFSAVAFGAGNVIRRYGLLETPMSILEGILINEATALIVISFYLFAAKDSRDVFDAPFQSYLLFIANGFLAGAGFLSLFIALDNGPVTIVDPLAAITPLVTAVLSHFFLRDIERVTLLLGVGATFICLGTILITVT